MRTAKTKTVEVEEMTDILCNKCGGSCKDDSDMNFEGLLEVTIRGGYASKLGDMVDYTFSLCETCLEKLFGEFKLPPESNADEEFAVRFLTARARS